jgi:hypothetical protein
MLSANDFAEPKACFNGRGLVEGSAEYESTYAGETLSWQRTRPFSSIPRRQGKATISASVRGPRYADGRKTPTRERTNP